MCCWAWWAISSLGKLRSCLSHSFFSWCCIAILGVNLSHILISSGLSLSTGLSGSRGHTFLVLVPQALKIPPRQVSLYLKTTSLAVICEFHYFSVYSFLKRAN